MSAKITGMVWDMILEPGEKYVLLAYADHADHEGRNIRPSIALIAKKTGHTIRGVQKKVSSLRAKGILVPVRYASGGRGHATEYRISFEKATFWGKGEPDDTLPPKDAPCDTLSPLKDELPDILCSESLNKSTPIESLKGVDLFSPTVDLDLKEREREPPLPPAPRSRRCPPAYAPTDALRTWAHTKYPQIDFDDALDAMRDCEFKDLRSDWDATLRNWIRREAKFHTATPGARYLTKQEAQAVANATSNQQLKDLVNGHDTYGSVWATPGHTRSGVPSPFGSGRQGGLLAGAR